MTRPRIAITTGEPAGIGPEISAAAATALADYEQDAEVLVKKAMQVAADICVYTNDQFTQETIEIQA